MQYYLEFNNNFKYIGIILFSISIIISFSNKSSISKLLYGNFWAILGQFSLYLYLIYYPIVTIVPILFPNYSPFIMLVIYIGLTFFAAFIIFCLEKYIIRLFKLLKKLIVKESV